MNWTDYIADGIIILLLLAVLLKTDKKTKLPSLSGNSAVVDKIISTIVSRKMTVFIIASIALFRGVLEGGDWVVIATAYIATQGVTNIVDRVYKARK